ncbi:MAG: hypothetical protein ACI9HK_006037, partial [Pirellulaceae bacterium]
QQVVESPPAENSWDIVPRRDNAEELTLDKQRLPLDAFSLELEAVIDTLANDIAQIW